MSFQKGANGSQNTTHEKVCSFAEILTVLIFCFERIYAQNVSQKNDHILTGRLTIEYTNTNRLN